VEENTLIGGLGSAILEYFNDNLLTEDTKIFRLGIPDVFAQHASREEQLEMFSLSVDELTQKVIDIFEQTQQIPRNITNLSHF
jgi:1-deoxy-D-xylulose-5-phosphate synthase